MMAPLCSVPAAVSAVALIALSFCVPYTVRPTKMRMPTDVEA